MTQETEGNGDGRGMRRRHAKVAYEAYRKAAGGVSIVSGVKLPEFDELNREIQEAWAEAAEAVYRCIQNAAQPSALEPGPPPDGPGGGTGQ